VNGTISTREEGGGANLRRTNRFSSRNLFSNYKKGESMLLASRTGRGTNATRKGWSGLALGGRPVFSMGASSDKQGGDENDIVRKRGGDRKTELEFNRLGSLLEVH